MFRHEHRTDHHNQRLAGFLALVAGFVNSAGFILLGTFTSHVTGNVGRFADDLVLDTPAAAVLAATMVVAFFAGAFLASMAIESNALRRRPLVYGGLLLAEAGLLAGFVVLARGLATDDARLQDAQALLLCAAMGLQNSLVTRLSGAVVRTTHLTGVVTDLGIEAARWFRYWRAHVSRHTRLRLVVGDDTTRPHGPKSILLLTIVIGFVAGSALGAWLALALRHLALLIPIGLLVSGSVYAVWRRDDLVAEDSHR